MTVHFEFDCDLETVYQTLTDPQYLVDRNLALGELSAEAEVDEDGDDTVITALREVSRDLPGFMAKLFNPIQIMDMREVWHPHDDGWRGEWKMNVRGQPVAISASFELVATESGCRYSVAHRAKAKIPLVGSRIEKYIIGQTTDGAMSELQYLRDYLA